MRESLVLWTQIAWSDAQIPCQAPLANALGRGQGVGLERAISSKLDTPKMRESLVLWTQIAWSDAQIPCQAPLSNALGRGQGVGLEKAISIKLGTPQNAVKLRCTLAYAIVFSINN